MKKAISLVLSLAMMLSILSACGDDSGSSTTTTDSSTGTTTTAAGATVTQDEETGGYVSTAPEALTEEPDGVVAGSSMVYTITADFVSLQLPGTFSGAQDIYAGIYDTLFYSPSGELDDFTGMLVDTWVMSDDWLTLTLTLREDAYFTNGKNVTAEDVEKSMDFHVYERGGVVLNNMAGYAATGEYEFEFYFTAPNVAYMIQLSIPHTSIFDATAYEELGNVTEAAYMAGSGPYYISDYAIGDYIVLTAKEDYWYEERQPHIETITCKVITYASTAHGAFVAGDTDYMMIVGYENMEAVLNVDEAYVVTAAGTPAYTCVWINSSEDALAGEYTSNPRVREALCMMIDVETLVLSTSSVYGRVGTNASSAAFEYTDNRTYDPEGALAILAEEGIDPADIQLTALCTSNNSTAFTVIQSMFMDCGVSLNFIEQDGPAVMTAGIAGSWDLWMEGGGMNSYNMATSFGVLMGETSVFQVVKDAEYQSVVAGLVETAFGSTSMEERDGYVNEILQILDENYLYLASTGGTSWFGFSDRIANIKYHYASNYWYFWDSWIAE